MTRTESTADERNYGCFEPDTLLPSQFADRTGGRRILDGERRLMVAILEDAVDVYRKQAAAVDTRKRHLFEAAEAWIEDRDPAWIFSFENICAVLDLDPGYIRRGLHAWKQRARSGSGAPVLRLAPAPSGQGEVRCAGGQNG